MTLHSKVQRFAESMQEEIDANSHKGDWETFLDKNAVWSEFFHHLNKLETACLNESDPLLVKEYIADCGNILMMLGNTYELYEDEENKNG
jgi:hypothetical protein